MKVLVASLSFVLLCDVSHSATVQAAPQVGFSSQNGGSTLPQWNAQKLINDQTFTGRGESYSGASGGHRGFDIGGGNGFSGSSSFSGGGNGLGSTSAGDAYSSSYSFFGGGNGVSLDTFGTGGPIGATDGRPAANDGFHGSGETGKEDSAQAYAFEYAIKDAATDNDFGQRENSDGRTVKGRYYVKLPDGRKQTVDYRADHEKGFTSAVAYEGEATTQQEYVAAQGGSAAGVLGGQIRSQGGGTTGVVAGTGASSQYATFPVAGQCMIFPGLAGQGQGQIVSSVPSLGPTGNEQPVKAILEPTHTGPSGAVPVPTGDWIPVPSPDGQYPTPTGNQGPVVSSLAPASTQRLANDFSGQSLTPLRVAGSSPDSKGQFPSALTSNKEPTSGSSSQLPTRAFNQEPAPSPSGQHSRSSLNQRVVTGINELPLEPTINLGPNTGIDGHTSFPSDNLEPAPEPSGQYPTPDSV